LTKRLGTSAVVAADLEPLVREAGRMALDFQGRVATEQKGDASFVSEADRAVERFLVGALAEEFPGDAIVGEEQGRAGGDDKSRVWAIDPIDGTAGYLAGLPTWCVSVGLVLDGEPTVGLVYLPATDEMFTADPTSGARLNGRPLRVRSDGPVLPDSGILSYSTTHLDFDVSWGSRLWSLSSAAVSIVYPCKGGLFGGLVDPVKSYDIAGAMAVLRAAGGELTYLGSGERVQLADFLLEGRAPDRMLACHPAFRAQLAGCFRPRAAG
jgi:myo-inositol-1(or 4)-monophosphatase